MKRPGAARWIAWGGAATLFSLCAVLAHGREPSAPAKNGVSAIEFSPPAESAIPNTPFGAQVRLGQAIFTETKKNAPRFVGNDLECSSCHLDAGRLANASPLWGAYVSYPAYRAKNGHVNTFAERLQGCFQFSMNGKAPALDDPVLVALESYAYFLAQGAPTGVTLKGRGYPTPVKPALSPDFARGASLYGKKCALCHGANGQGQTAHNQVAFPPLWGTRSYNWGAGMSVIKNAAGFIQANMPLSQGGTLSDQEAWDVALFVDSHERPQDPRFDKTVSNTRKLFHGDDDQYGQQVNGVLLGSGPLKNPGAVAP